MFAERARVVLGQFGRTKEQLRGRILMKTEALCISSAHLGFYKNLYAICTFFVCFLGQELDFDSVAETGAE